MSERRAGRPTKWVLVALALYGILVTTSPIVSAQPGEAADSTSPGPIVTDRPTASASPLVVPRRTFQLEMGHKGTHTKGDPESIDAQVFPDLLARYGINRKIEVRLASAGWTVESGPDERATGFSDISLGAKIALAEEKGRRPQMGFLVDVSLPVGHSDFTTDRVVPKFLFLGSNTLSDRLGLTYNIGPGFVASTDNGKSDTNAELEYAVALSGSVGGPFSLFGEFFGAFTFGSNLPDRHSFQAGTTILLSPRFQIDIRGGLGLVEGVPDWLIGAGLAFRVPH
jgi:hypothetical protein